jgi:hypothetical protein
MSRILNRDDRKEFSREELEEMRSALLELVEVSALFSLKGAAKTGAGVQAFSLNADWADPSD